MMDDDRTEATMAQTMPLTYTDASIWENTSKSDVTVTSEPWVNEASDAIWILTSTFIIFTMQSGFGLLESGMVTTKNEVNIMVKNAVDVILGGLTYWALGYALSFGAHEWSNGFNGWGDFFVQADEEELGSLYSKFFFQASFATTSTTIVSGAMAERTRLEAYMVFSVLNTLIFAFPSHWVWAPNGWLHNRGIVDIAGAGPVHVVGGVTGLVATLMLKPRHGRYSKDTKHAPPMGCPTNALLGMFMLWWGWLGFNCGSTFGISGFKWKLAARSAVATLQASMAGGCIGVLSSYIFKKRTFDIGYLINGILGALVAITGLCALAQPWQGFTIGGIGAALTLGTNELLERMQIDDPVGVVGVHAVGGAWSLISIGLFMKDDKLKHSLIPDHEKSGLFFSGDASLLGIQSIGAASIVTWTVLTSFICLKLIDLTLGLRVPLQQEILGSDTVEHSIGDIEYDKIKGEVVAFRRLNDDGSGVIDDVDSMRRLLRHGHANLGQIRQLAHWNTSKVRQRRSSNMVSAESVENVMNATFVADDLPEKGSNDDDDDDDDDGSIIEATGTSNGTPVRTIRQPGEHKKAAAMWKYSASRVMSASERRRRQQVASNFDDILRQRNKLTPCNENHQTLGHSDTQQCAPPSIALTRNRLSLKCRIKGFFIRSFNLNHRRNTRQVSRLDPLPRPPDRTPPVGMTSLPMIRSPSITSCGKSLKRSPYGSHPSIRTTSGSHLGNPINAIYSNPSFVSSQHLTESQRKHSNGVSSAAMMTENDNIYL